MGKITEIFGDDLPKIPATRRFLIPGVLVDFSKCAPREPWQSSNDLPRLESIVSARYFLRSKVLHGVLKESHKVYRLAKQGIGGHMEIKHVTVNGHDIRLVIHRIEEEVSEVYASVDDVEIEFAYDEAMRFPHDCGWYHARNRLNKLCWHISVAYSSRLKSNLLL